MERKFWLHFLTFVILLFNSCHGLPQNEIQKDSPTNVKMDSAGVGNPNLWVHPHVLRLRRHAEAQPEAQQYNSNLNQLPVKLIGSYGIKCTTPCSRNHWGASYSYFFCYGEGTWDYCSNSFEYDYRGKRCKDFCDTRGYSYRWCYLEEGGWGYCSGTRGY